MSDKTAPAHLPSVRALHRARPDDPASAMVLALCDEIEALRLDLDRARRAEAYHERDARLLREERYRMRTAIAAAIGAGR